MERKKSPERPSDPYKVWNKSKFSTLSQDSFLYSEVPSESPVKMFILYLASVFRLSLHSLSKLMGVGHRLAILMFLS